METKTKLKIWASILGIIVLAYAGSLLFASLSLFCVQETCVIYAIVWIILAPFFLISLVFTVVYFYKYRGLNINTKKFAILSWVIFLLSLLGFGITQLIFFIDQNSSAPMMANPNGQITLFIIAGVSLFFTIVFYLQNRRKMKDENEV